MAKESDPLVEATEKLNEDQGPSSLQKDMLDEIEEIPDLAPMPRTDSPATSAPGDSSPYSQRRACSIIGSTDGSERSTPDPVGCILPTMISTIFVAMPSRSSKRMPK